MKRILLAFDGRHFSEAVFEFAKQLNQQQPISVTGIFLPPIDYVELLYSFGGIPSGPMYMTEVVREDDEKMKKNIAHFKKVCEAANIKYDVHNDLSAPVTAQVASETRFADLLVLSSKSFYENLDGDEKDEYIAEVLHKAECPVVLIPDKLHEPDSIIMAYDGSEQSVFAIKQFAYLFPQFCDKRVLLVFFDHSAKGVPERSRIEDYASKHFPHLTILKLKMSSKKEIETWMQDNGDTLLVAGAHSRSMLSEMFKGSFINDVIHHHKIPVFVAHK